MFTPTPVSNKNVGFQKALTTDQLDPLLYVSKWLKQRHDSVKKTNTDPNLKGFKKQVEEAYKEGYITALSDVSILLANLLKTGKCPN